MIWTIECRTRGINNPIVSYVFNYKDREGAPTYDVTPNRAMADGYEDDIALKNRNNLADYYGTGFDFRLEVVQSEIESTLSQRGARYGDFTENAKLSQAIKEVMYKAPFNEKLNAVHKEALEVIVQKISRILNGDPDYKDNWHDIAGYAKLAEDRCGGDKE